jgi:Predicted transcriptional regulator
MVNLLKSVRGPAGGYVLDKNPKRDKTIKK